MPRLGDAALRCLLGLFRLSFRFDPKESHWTCPETWLPRRDLQEETGLSDEGTRKGLSELTEEGWAEVDRGGQAHEWRLCASVPTKRFTYVPTSLLSRASELPTGAALRTALAVLRETWGWTHARENVSTGPTEAPSSASEVSSSEASSCGSCRNVSCGNASCAGASAPCGEEEEGREHVHQKWARLSHRELASATGRSETAVKKAAEALQGRWLCRRRPGHGAFYYRIRPEALAPGPSSRSTSEKREEAGESLREERKTSPNSARKTPFSKTTPANELGGGAPTDWHPPPFIREFLERSKHTGGASPDPFSEKSPEADDPTERDSAVRGDSNPSENTSPGGPDRQKSSSGPPDFSDFSDEKQALGQKLINAGIWPGRAHECLRRYSTTRVAANFDLWRARKNDPEAPEIENDGAWLCMAITDGYASANPERSSSEQGSSQGSSPNRRPPQPDDPGAGGRSEGAARPPEPSHKQRVSPQEKDALIRHYECITPEQFHRFRHGESPAEKQFLYFEEGSPTSRGKLSSADRRD
ncbi:hypothetical protein GGQ00_003016 [Salinibacter ruber]|uniref:hypothetical protein n=1 Tax=Salinibacter ruber TaxID=146919 RepID=UPI00216A2F97|nr:hypothetical protein [Salinibacter ruber]MCS4044556.1 hypothetical protein [Salinibacter ruber]